MGKITVFQINKGKIERVETLPKCSLFNKYNKMVEEEEQQVDVQQVETSFIEQNSVGRTGQNLNGNGDTDRRSNSAGNQVNGTVESSFASGLVASALTGAFQEVEWSRQSNLVQESSNAPESTRNVESVYLSPGEVNQYDEFMSGLEELNKTFEGMLTDNELWMLPPPSYEEVVNGTWTTSWRNKQLQTLNDAILSHTSYSVPVHQHQDVNASEMATTNAMVEQQTLSSTIVNAFAVSSPVVSKLEDLVPHLKEFK